MAGRIAGITIEIGGNTTKLQTALKGVDNQLKTTQANLKDINKLLKFNPGNVELLTQKQKNLQAAVQQTKDRLSQLKDAQSQVAKGSDEWDRLQCEIIATEQELQKAETALQQFGSVGAQQVAAAGKTMEEFGNKVSDVGNKMKPISTAAGALVTAMVGLGYSSMTAADDLNTLSKQSGLSTDSLQKFQYASDRVDVSVDAISGAVTKLKKNMGGSGEAFENLGVAVTDANGNMRSAEDVFFDTVKALSEIPNEVERDQAAYEVFGKSADELAGIIDDGGEAFRKYGQEAEDLGLILSGDTLNAINESNDAIDKSKAQLKAAGLQLGATIATGLAPAIDKISAGVEKLVGWLQQLTPEQTNMIMTIAGIVAAVAPVLIIGGKIISGVSKLLQLAPMLASAISFLLSPVGLVIAGIVALIAVGVLLYKNWDTIKTFAINTWNGIVTSVTTFIENIKTALSTFADSARESMAQTWENVKTAASEAWDKVITTLSDAAEKFVDVGKKAIDKIREGISSAWEGLKSWFSGIWDSLFGNLHANVEVDASASGIGQYATGLNYVPYDGFPAILHRGEAVLTAQEATDWRSGTGSGATIDYDRLAAAISSRPIVIEGDTNKIFRVVRTTNTVRTRATNYNALGAGAYG